MKLPVRHWLTRCLFGVGLTSLVPSAAAARDVWSAPHPGIRHLHRVGDGPGLHVVTVDLRHPELDLVTSSPGDAPERTEDFAARNDAFVALGARLAPATTAPQPWMLHAGRPVVASIPSGARSAAGVTADGATLVMVTLDAAQPGEGALATLSGALAEFDASEAVALDAEGGGDLVLAGVAATAPTSGPQATAAGHLGVRVRPGAVWWSAEVVAHGGAADVAPGEVAELWVEARNTGRRPWRTVFEGGGSPVLALDDGAHRFMASVETTTYPGEVGRFLLRWVSTTTGRHGLGARLSLPDGASLEEAPLRYDVAVRDEPAPAADAAPPVAMAGLGCNTVAGGPAPGAWAGLAALTAAAIASRRRRRAG